MQLTLSSTVVGLNPCFSGTYSQRVSFMRLNSLKSSLNPCFSGTYSQRVLPDFVAKANEVLILVLVEHTLRGCYSNGV